MTEFEISGRVIGKVYFRRNEQGFGSLVASIVARCLGIFVAIPNPGRGSLVPGLDSELVKGFLSLEDIFDKLPERTFLLDKDGN